MWSIFITLLFVFLVLFYLLRKKLTFSINSPVYFYIIFYCLVILSTIIYWYFLPFKINLYFLEDNVSDQLLINTINYYWGSLIFFIIGANFYLAISKNSYLFKDRGGTISYDNLFNGRDKLFKLFCNVAIFMTIFNIIVIILSYEGWGLFYRKQYLEESINIFKILQKPLSILSSAILGIVFTKKKMGLALFLILLLFIFGTGSRIIFACTTVFLLTNYVFGKKSFLKNFIRGFYFVLSLLLIGVVLTLRNNEFHGIGPYLLDFWTDEDSIWEKAYFNVYYLLNFGVFMTIKTIEHSDIDLGVFSTMYSPLPGFMTNWYQILDKVTYRPYIPFTAHGQLFKLKYFLWVIHFFILGGFYSYMEKHIRISLNKGNIVYALLIFALLLASTVYAFEYTLRSSNRYLYYALFLVFISFFMKKIKFPRIKLK